MKYGDAVAYIRDGVQLNAIVLSERGDNLNLVYLDPESESLVRTHGAITKTEFNVPPMVDGARNGWEEFAYGIVESGLTQKNKFLADRVAELDKANAELSAQVVELKNQYPIPGSESWLSLTGAALTPSILDMAQDIADQHDGHVSLINVGKRLPSAADLDAVAAEQKAKEESVDGDPSPVCPPHGPCEVTEHPTAEVEAQK